MPPESRSEQTGTKYKLFLMSFNSTLPTSPEFGKFCPSAHSSKAAFCFGQLDSATNALKIALKSTTAKAALTRLFSMGYVQTGNAESPVLEDRKSIKNLVWVAITYFDFTNKTKRRLYGEQLTPTTPPPLVFSGNGEQVFWSLEKLKGSKCSVADALFLADTFFTSVELQRIC